MSKRLRVRNFLSSQKHVATGIELHPAHTGFAYNFTDHLVTSSFMMKAQNPGILCTHYNVNNGLLNSSVEYVYVDREGYVWFASTTGLQKFDGFNFTNYVYNSEDSSSVSYNFISSLFEDRDGKIWIGTLKGLDMFNKEDGVFFHMKNDPFNHLSFNNQRDRERKKGYSCRILKDIYGSIQ